MKLAENGRNDATGNARDGRFSLRFLLRGEGSFLPMRKFFTDFAIFL
jgi:hypothetical protein